MEWQPIETAPKGTTVLLYRPMMSPRDRIAIRDVRDWCGPSCCPSAEPTHWMPLPAPPTDAGKAMTMEQGTMTTKKAIAEHVRAIQRAVEAKLPEDEPDDVRPWVYETAVKVMIQRLGKAQP